MAFPNWGGDADGGPLNARVFDGEHAASQLYDAIWEVWPDAVNDIGHDYYDNSVELYMAPLPADWRVSGIDLLRLAPTGFTCFYFNHADSTIEVGSIRDGVATVTTRHHTDNPRLAAAEFTERRDLCRTIRALRMERDAARADAKRAREDAALARADARAEARTELAERYAKDLRDAYDQAAVARRERDMWRANHDNQVAMRRAVLDRPDMGPRGRLVADLYAQRDNLLRVLGDVLGEYWNSGHLQPVQRSAWEVCSAKWHLARWVFDHAGGVPVAPVLSEEALERAVKAYAGIAKPLASGVTMPVDAEALKAALQAYLSPW